MSADELNKSELEFELENEPRWWVCAEHAIDVLHVHTRCAVCKATSQQNIKKRDIIRNMLMVSGAHKSQQKEQRSVEPEGRKLRKRSAEHEPGSSSAETDYLSSLFTAARPYIQGTSFTYSILVTLLRAILILNSVFDYGGRIWYGNYEGEDVCRFFCVLGTIYPRRVLSVLRGDSHNAYMVRADGSKIFNLGSIGLPCVPSARTVQELMAVPRPIPQIMTITAESISIALGQFNAMADPSSFLLCHSMLCMVPRILT